MSVRIIKAFDPEIDAKPKIKKRDSHFLYFRGQTAEWAWYDNDGAKYMEYALGPGAVKQLEASYQGVQSYNFPLDRYIQPKCTVLSLFVQIAIGQLYIYIDTIVQIKKTSHYLAVHN